MKITTKDIAKLAGVSRGTVDRALNNRGQIAPEVKDQILKIAKEHGYVKNTLASSLAKNIEKKIAIVMPEPSTDTYWRSMHQGIDSSYTALQNHGIDVKYFPFDIKEANTYLNAMQQTMALRPDAILTTPLFYKEAQQFVLLAEQNNIPLVCINSDLKDDRVTFVGQDSYETGRIAGQLFSMANTGRGNILTLTLGHHASNASHIEDKINGVKDYCKQLGNKVTVSEYAIARFEEPEIIRQAAEQIISEYPGLTGIFFTNSRAHLFADHSRLFEELSQKTTLIGFDLIPQNIQLLENEKIDFLLNQNPIRQGELGILSIFSYLSQGLALPSKQYIPIDIAIKENYKKYLAEEV